MSYPNLLSELRVGDTVLPNRMVMGAMHTRLETLDRPHERLAAFYATRAAGEVGLILTGGYSPTPEGVMDEGGPLLNSEEQLPEHRLITSEVHKAGGASSCRSSTPAAMQRCRPALHRRWARRGSMFFHRAI